MKEIFVLAVAVLCATSAWAVTDAEKKQLDEYCKPDVERLCSGVEPGDGRIEECLKKNEKELSVGCAEVLEQLKKS